MSKIENKLSQDEKPNPEKKSAVKVLVIISIIGGIGLFLLMLIEQYANGFRHS